MNCAALTEPSVDGRLAAHSLRAVEGLEVQEVAVVDQPRDHLAHVVGLAVVDRHHAGELIGAVARLQRGLARQRRQALVPGQLGHDLAGDVERVSVILRQVFSDARDHRVHLGAAQLLVGGDLAGGGLEQRRAGEEDLGAPLHHHDVVGEARMIGAPGGRGAVHHRDMRDAHRRHARHVGEGAAAVDEDLGLVVEVGAARFHQRDVGQLVGQHDLLHAQRFAQAHGGRGAALDAGVARRDDATHTRHSADAGDDAAALDVLGAVVVVHLEAGQGGDLQERRAAVDEMGQALARGQLAALLEHGELLVGGIAHPRLQRTEALDQRQHVAPVDPKRLGIRIDAGLQDGH
jgi:hypothetical protein